MKTTCEPIPADFAVQPLKPGERAEDKATCGHCRLSWDDAKSTDWTPTPGGRCPFEYFHLYPKEKRQTRPVIVLRNEDDETDIALLAVPPKGMDKDDAQTLIWAAIDEAKDRYPEDWNYENVADILRVSGFKFPKYLDI